MWLWGVLKEHFFEARLHIATHLLSLLHQHISDSDAYWKIECFESKKTTNFFRIKQVFI